MAEVDGETMLNTTLSGPCSSASFRSRVAGRHRARNIPESAWRSPWRSCDRLSHAIPQCPEMLELLVHEIGRVRLEALTEEGLVVEVLDDLELAAVLEAPPLVAIAGGIRPARRHVTVAPLG